MNELNLYEAINLIDDDLIIEAAQEEWTPRAYTCRSTPRWYIAAGSVAAVGVIAVGAIVLPKLKNSGNLPVNSSFGEFSSALSEGAVLQSSSSNTFSASHDQSSAPDMQKGGVEIDGAYYQVFECTPFAGIDLYLEPRHMEIITPYGEYHQLLTEEYSKYNIDTEIAVSDFGDYIGKVSKTGDSQCDGNAAESLEPNITGADVYYYAPAGKSKALLIVKNGRQCSIFVDDRADLSGGFMNGFSFFDVESAADIESVSFEIYVPVEGGRMEISTQGTISDSVTINELFGLLSELEPEDYSKLPPHIGTPQWLVDAWEAYDANPSSRTREDINFSFRLKNGFVIAPIEYQPYIGNGYVEHMQELTPGQNKALRAFFD